jgi:hypothetical protein
MIIAVMQLVYAEPEALSIGLCTCRALDDGPHGQPLRIRRVRLPIPRGELHYADGGEDDAYKPGRKQRADAYLLATLYMKRHDEPEW